MSSRLVPLAAGALLAAIPAPALAQSGGAAAPDSGSGGHVFEQASPKRPAPRLRASIFTVTPGRVEAGGTLRFTWRVDGPVRRVTARVVLTPQDGGRATTVRLGSRASGRRSVRTWKAKVAAGRYTARLNATGPRGARLRRTARASGRLSLEVVAPAPPPAPAPTPTPTPPPAPANLPGTFPVQGAFTFGGAGARFGAGRTGHVHQGQDVVAAEGTPVVSPVAGVVYWRAFQAGGAGYYVVVRGDDGRDYAFMHFQEGSTLVAKGQRVAAGQRLASVGNTGDSQGAHLHFEIWPDGWYASADSHPIDPLPQLLAWAGLPALP